MVYVGVVASLLGAIAGFFTAYYMRTQVMSGLPFLEGEISDIGGAEKRGSLAEKLQEDGCFILRITIYGGDGNFRFNKIKTSGALIGEMPLYSFEGIVKDTFVSPSKNNLCLPINYMKDSEIHFSFLIKPDIAEEGKVRVSVSGGLFSSLKTEVPYKKTEYFQ